jgi:hypothetical protein
MITTLLGYGSVAESMVVVCTLLCLSLARCASRGLFSASTIRTSAQNRSGERSGHVTLKQLMTSALVGLAYGMSFAVQRYPDYGLRWFYDVAIFGPVIGLSCLLLMVLLPRSVLKQIQVPPSTQRSCAQTTCFPGSNCPGRRNGAGYWTA